MSSDCSICLESKSANIQAACVPCGHTFCWTCITEWAQASGHCPQCRSDIERVQRLYNTDRGHGETNGERRKAEGGCGIVRPLVRHLPLRLTAAFQHISVSPCDAVVKGKDFFYVQKENAQIAYNTVKQVCRRTRRKWSVLGRSGQYVITVGASLFLALLWLDLQHPTGVCHSILKPCLRPFLALLDPLQGVLFGICYACSTGGWVLYAIVVVVWRALYGTFAFVVNDLLPVLFVYCGTIVQVLWELSTLLWPSYLWLLALALYLKYWRM